MSQESGGEQPRSPINESLNKESEFVTAPGSPSSEEQSSNFNTSVDNQKIVVLPPKNATGPRTIAGKQRSSRNSIKHGIFSCPVLLGGEDSKVYRSLLKALDESIDSHGMLESLLIEKLATIVWRYRRLLLAENAAIHKNVHDLELKKGEREERKVEAEIRLDESLAQVDREGLIAKIAEPGIAGKCLQKLHQLKDLIEDDGFYPGYNEWAYVGRVYGARYQGRPGKDLFDVYNDCVNATHLSAEERQKKGFASKEDCVKKFLVELDKEIQRFEDIEKKQPVVRKKPEPADIELLGCKVPDTEDLDRLLRYEASLERAFDRTLNQLERLQRMRLGQPVPPKLEVQHTLT